MGRDGSRCPESPKINKAGTRIKHPASLLSVVIAAALTFGLLASRNVDRASATPCAVPGSTGPGGTLGGIVNTYFPGATNAAAGATSISVGTSRGAATPIADGDLLLVIQMQDAAIDSTNTDTYGDGVVGSPASGSTALNNAGRFEYVRATGPVAAGSVPVQGAGAGTGLVTSYTNAASTATQGQRRFQVVRVPQYSSATLGSTLTASPWDGRSGGILALDVTGPLALGTAAINLSALGFRGGGPRQLTGGAGGVNTDYRTLATSNFNGQKGEGIAGTPRYVRNGLAAATDTGTEGYPNGSSARGAPGNAGGGGTDGNPTTNDQNSGGGGGANGGAGGIGGNTWSTNLPRGGFGGRAFTPSVSQLVMGGGGGAGSRNNSPTIAAASAGGNGGGMAMIRAGSLTGTGSITSDGQTGVTPENDSGGGGGAGGSITVLSAGGGTAGLTVNARGAVGGDAEQATSGSHGPGGGGGGGAVVLSGAPAAFSVAGGISGDTNNGSGTFITYGAGAGSAGTSTTSATLPTVPGTSAGVECTPQLTVTKTTSTPIVFNSGSGGTATYTITVANAAGRGDATGVSISDALPAGFTYASTTTVALSGGATRPTTTDPPVGATTPAWSSFTIPGGGQVQITFGATVAAAASGTYQNPATATYTDPARTVAGATLTASYSSASSTGEDVLVRRPNADLGVTKTVSNPNPALNGNVTFTVTATNNGPEVGTGVSVNDLLPAGLTYVSSTPSVGTYTPGTGVWAVGTLANGASATLALVATATTVSPVINTATITTTSTDSNGLNNSASATVNVLDANLAVTKTVSNATPALNTNVTFTVTVNNGGGDAAQAVSVADALPAGLTLVSATPSTGSYAGGVWTVGTLANGATATLSIVATVTTHTAITNTATASSATYDPVAANNTASATVNVPDANLAVTKTVSNATPTLNSNVTFTVTVTNNGPSTAQSVSVADALPAGLTLVSATPSTGTYSAGVWTVGSMVNGASATLSIVATVTIHTAITNTATATSTTFDPVAADNSASATVNVPDANLAVTKTVSNATPALNSNVTFTVTVTNNGPDSAQAVSVADALPAGLTLVSATPSTGTYGAGIWTVGNMANSASATLSIVAQVTTYTLLTNTATATTTTFDPTPANNTASASVNVPDANLAVVKTVSNGTPALNSNVTFTVTVTNNGPATSANVSVADALPGGLTFVSSSASQGSYAAGVWTVGSLANGATATLSIVATVTTHTLQTNTATATSSTLDPTPANDSASATVNVPDADLQVAKSVSNATPAINTNVTFSVVVTNGGPNTAAAVSVADALPVGLTLVSSSATQGSYASGVWTVGALANGAAATLSIVATVTSHTLVTNTATASSTTFDPTPGNNAASAIVNVPDAELQVSKTVDNATPALNTNVTFTIGVTNNGPDVAQTVSVSDVLPAGLVFVSSAPSTGSYNSGTGAWAVGNMANGASATLSIVATVTTHTALTNTATATSTTFDPTSGNNAASATVNVPDADLQVSKTVNNATPAINNNVTFTVSLTNNGPNTAVNVSVADALPAGLSLVSTSPSQGSYSTGVWTAGSVANGATATLQIVATVMNHTAITNTANVTSSTYDPNGANDTASASVNVPDANLAITKSVDNPTPALSTNVTFTVVVTNIGPDTATAVTVADTLPVGLTFVSSSAGFGSYVGGVWTVGSLANGASATLAITATVTTHTALTNTATASTTTYDPVSGNDSAAAGVNVPDADLQVTKAVDNGQPNVNDNVTFTVTVTNNGPDAATGVSVADALPAGLTFVSASTSTGAYAAGVWTVGTLGNGASATLDIVATVTASGPILNTATATANQYDPVGGNNAASASVGALQADIAVTKTVDNAAPALGTDVTFTITLTNTGPSTATAVSVADPLPVGLTLVSATPSVGSYSGGAWTVGDVASGATPTLQIVATPTTLAPVTNTATASATTFDPDGANNSASVTVDVPNADLALTKSVDATTPAYGANVTFTVSVTNNGPDTAAGVSVADALPSGLTLVSATPSVGTYTGGVWTIGALANGVTRTLTIVAQVTSATSVTNTATVSATTADQTPGNNSAAASVNALDADVAINKVVDNASPALGANVTFTVTVTNNGPDTAMAVAVADAVPTGLTLVSATPSVGTYASGVWTVGDVTTGVSRTLTIVATVTVHTAVTNTATASSATFDPAPGNNTASATVNVADANLAVTKIVTNATPVIGSNVTFTVTVTNTGPDTATAAQVTDALPGGLTLVSANPSVGTYASGVWAIGDLTSGASASLDIVTTVTAHTAITNTATASSPTFDPSTSDNAASAVVDVPDADLEVTKTVDDATPALGANVTFTVTVANQGPDTANGVIVADALPAGLTLVSATPSTGIFSTLSNTWSVGAVANGAAPTLSIVATVTDHAPLTNTATASSTTFDPDAVDNSASAGVDVPDADLAVAKTVDVAAPAIGSNVVFTVTVTNNGPSTASAVSVADPLPPGLALVGATASAGTYASGVWNVGNMPSGATQTLQITATVTSHTPITNTATASSPTLDPVPANDTASIAVDVPDADLAVTKSVDTAAPALGANVTFTITLANNGPNAAAAVTVADTLPAGLTLVSSTASFGSFTSGVWTVGNLPAGAVETLTVLAQVTSDAQMTNTASVSSSTYDPVAGNNAGSAVVDVPNADLAVTKTVGTTMPALGTNVTFTVTVTNLGPDTAAAVAVADTLPPGLTLVSATPSVGTYSGGIWSVGTLGAGAARTLTIVATVTDHVAITNTATATTTTRDTVAGNDSASATVDVPDADLAVTNTVDNPTPAVGANVTYTVTVTNNGPVAATGVTVSDALPAGLTPVSSSATLGTYAAGSWSVGPLAVGASETLTILATVTTHTPVTTIATVSGSQLDTVSSNDSAAVTVNARDADIAVAKVVNNPTPDVGENVTFTITVTNAGPDTATAVSVADTLPAGLSFVSATASVGTYAAGLWNIGALSSGASATLDITATVTVGSLITNTATATTATYDPNGANDTASATVDARSADLVVTKTVSNATPAFGANVTFTVSAANAGPDTAANVHVADVLPAGLTLVSATPSIGTYVAGDWNLGSLANGASATLAILATVTNHLPITNTATISSATQDLQPANDTATAIVDVPDADVVVTKTVSNPTPAINTDVTFVVTVTNNGPSTATAVTVADTLPAGLNLQSATASVGTYSGTTWTAGSLANGQVETLTVIARVTDPGLRTNVATATSTTYDPASANNTASAAVDVYDVDLAVTNIVDNPNPEVNDTVTFTVNVENQGPNNATGVQVTYPLPAGLTLVSASPSVGTYSGGVWTIGNLLATNVVTMTVTATVDVAALRTTTATVSGAEYDPDAADNTATASVDARQADLVVTKVVDDPNPPLGTDVTFTVTVHNNGPDTSTGVTVADTLPGGLTLVSSSASVGTYGAGVWTVGSLANGVTETLTILATVISPAVMTNTATVDATTSDPLAANDSYFATVYAQQADVVLTKTVDNATPALNTNVTFSVTVRNDGPFDAAAVRVDDALPAGLQLQSSSATAGTYAADVWNVGTLLVGETHTLTIVARVTDPSPQTNIAVVSGGTYDPVPGNGTGSAIVDVPDADLAVTNTVDNPTPDVGDDVTFTVTVHNNGPSDATGVVVTDPLPGGLTISSAIPSVGTFSAGTWTVGGLANGATQTLTIIATVGAATPLTTTATALANELDTVPANNVASAGVDARDADLNVTKTVSNATPDVGANVTFTVTVRNTGPNTARTVAVADALPADLTLVSSSATAGGYSAGTWNVGDLANGATAILTIVTTVDGPNPMINTATASAATFDASPGDNTASAAVDARDADLVVAKTVDVPAPSLGADVTYTVSVTNTGPDAANATTVNDTLPAGLTLVSSTPSVGTYGAGVWTIGTLANGAAVTLTIVARVTSSAAITNTALVSSTTFDGDGTNNADSATVDVPEVDLAVTKTVDNSAPALNDIVTFTIAVTNNGPDDAVGVNVADALPAGLTQLSATPSVGTYGAGNWAVGPVVNGVTETLVVTARVTLDAPISNTATAGTATLDSDPANDSATAQVDVPTADLVVTKVVDNATPQFGGDVVFTVTVTNNGPEDAAGVTVADTLPAGLNPTVITPSTGTYAAGSWNVGALASGASATLTVQAQVASISPMTNTATATTPTNDPDSANNTASATVDAPAANLAVSKAVDNASPSVGTNVTFTVTATNNGPDAATGVVVTDLLPAGLAFQSATPSSGSYDSGTGVWTVGALANGATVSLDIVAQVTVAGGLTNTATAAANEHDVDSADNSASASVAGVRADLAVTKTVDDATPALGGTVTFTVTVSNNGPDTATAVVVTDLLPAGLTFQSAIASVGSYNFGTGDWTVGNLADAATGTLTLIATVDVTTPTTNSASATSATFDHVPANNTDTAAVDVPDADLVITKSVDDPAPAINGTVTYLVTVTNSGPDTATAVAVTDVVPGGLTVLSATPSTGAYTVGTGAWTVGNMANGASQTLVIVARVTSHLAIVNTASVSSTTLDQVPANDSDSVTVDVPDADLAVTKSVDTPAPALGANVTFTVGIANNGPDTAVAATVADVLPAGLTLVSATPSVGAYNSGTGDWVVGDLINGATATLTIVATVTAPTPITNTATATATTYDPATPNSASATVDVPQTDVGVTKTVDDATPDFGANATFTVTVTNTGTDLATGVTVADTLPPGLTLVTATPTSGAYASGTWTVGTLTSGQSETLTVVAQVLTGVSVTNTATVSATTLDTNSANDVASASVNAPDADLAVAKSVDDATPAPNGSVTFTVTLTNNGPDAAPDVHVADVLPAGLTATSSSVTAGAYAAGDWDLGTVANGATETLTIVATVTSSIPITNTATATSGAYDLDPSNDTDTASVDVPDADLGITKTVDDPSPALNATVVFVLTVTNAGPDTAPGTRVADVLPAGLTLLSATASTGSYASGVWTIGAIAIGTSETLTVNARVTTATLITNTATVSARAADPDPANDSASATVDVPDADVAVTKTVSDPTPVIGSDVTFTVTVTNNGPDSAAGVGVADALPAGLTLVSATPSSGTYATGVWTLGAMPNGDTETLDIVATVTQTSLITNTATVTSTSFDATSGNDSASATVDVPDADLSIAKSVDNAAPALNANVTFSVIVTNNGPSSAASVEVSDVLPAGLAFVSASSPAYVGNVWTIGSLANGAQATLDIVAQVTGPAAITNTATVTSTTLDPDATNNSDTATVDVPGADLTLAKTVDDATPNEGQNVTYTVTLTNNGPDAATGVDVTDVLPAGLAFVSATPAAGTFSAGVWSLASVPSGATRTLDIVATVTAQGVIVNTAEVTASGTFDPTSTPGDATGDDVASATITPLPPVADLALTLGASTTTPVLGGTVTYTLTVTNAGPAATSSVSVVDLLPAGVTYISSSASLGTYDSGTATWTIGALASGQSASLAIVVTVDQAGVITNTAEIGSSTVTDPDSTPANGSGTEDDEAAIDIAAQSVTPPPAPTSADLEIVKSASQSVATVGDTISYAIVVTNNGPGAATNVQVLEQLPPALQFVTARASAGVYDLSTFVWSIPTIPNGGAASLVVTTHVVAPGSITNAVQVLSGDQPDPDGPFNTAPGAPGGEQSSATVVVSGPPPAPTRLSISKKGAKVIKAGGTVTFTIRIKNTGTVPATNVVMSDCIPGGLSLTRGGRMVALRKNGRLGWQVGTLQPGQTRVVRVVLRADRDTRGMRSCTAVASAANAATVRAGAGVRVVAGVAVSDRARVTG